MLPSVLAGGAGGGMDLVRRRGLDIEEAELDVERMDCARAFRLRPWSGCGASSSFGRDVGLACGPGACFHAALLEWLGLCAE